MAETPPAELTGRQVAKIAKSHAGDSDEVRTVPARESAKARRTHALAALRRLELAVQELRCADQVKLLLGRIERMIGESG
ncbi:MAG: hypothetical protein MUC42_10690 [Bryobacter sp.]|nr:hypothetical protein [Bryobacter sp.]